MRKKLLSFLLAVLLLAGVASPGVFAHAAGALTITAQPKDVSVNVGATANVTVNASGDGLTYQWYCKEYGGVSFVRSSIKTKTYSVVMNTARDGRQLYCVITDKYGNQVQTNTVTLRTKATILTQPKSVAVEKGDTARVELQAAGKGLTYQWYFKNKSALLFKKTDTFTSNVYTVSAMDSVRNGRQVYCVVTDKYGNKVQSNTVTLSIAKPVSITKQPANVSAAKGATAKVSFTASGDGLTYQWYFKNAGASKFKATSTFTSNVYTVSAMDSVRDGRQIYCVVTDKYGNKVQTNTVTLTMTNPVTITKQPASVSVPKGASAKVSFTASGDGLTYQWYFKNKSALLFKKTDTFTSNVYTISAMDATRDGRQIYCVVTDKYGNKVQTNTVTLKMTTAAANPVTITKQPVSVSVPKGEKAEVSFTASGDGLTYKWYYKNAGASKFSATSTFTSNTYAVTMDATRDGRQIYCVVTDKYGNKVQTNTVTLKMTAAAANPVTITKQPASVTVPKGEKAEVSFTAKGDGLTYKWYYKNAGASKFSATSSFTSNVYTISAMDATRDGRQVYCVVTDKYGNKATTKTVTLSMEKNYQITVHTGQGEPVVIKASGGRYALEAPTKVGYVFAGWETAAGSAFAASGTVSADVSVHAVWKLDGTDTLAELVERTDAGVDRILITGNITLNQPLFISTKTTIYADADYTLKRDPNYAGDLFVVGQDRNGVNNLLLHRKAVLTLGGGKGTLTIDGNQSQLKVTVVGSAVYVVDSGTLNLYDGVAITNHKKLGNERSLNCGASASTTVKNRVGGAAVLNMNGVVNMYGGLIKGNSVLTKTTATTDSSGNTVNAEIACNGGAIYTRGSLYMYGGSISNNKALNGGAIYCESYTTLVAGTLSGNSAAQYGGAIVSSGSANCSIYLGSAEAGKTLTISGNTSAKAGGAVYSSTDSSIVVYGNTTFSSNTSQTQGGAIYTSGGLTVRNTAFTGNKATSTGGAIHHNFTQTDKTRRDLNVSDSAFTGNSANHGGAISLGAVDSATKGTYATIKKCTFTENRAASSDGKSGNGGALYATKLTEATLNSCTFTANTAAGTGGAVDVSGGSYVKVNAITATGNKSTVAQKGAVIHLTGSGSKVHLTGTVSVKDNVAGAEDSFLYAADSALLYTTYTKTAAWVKLTYSASAIQYGKTP